MMVKATVLVLMALEFIGVAATKRDYVEGQRLTVDDKVEWREGPELVVVPLRHWINQPWHCSTSGLLDNWENIVSLLFTWIFCYLSPKVSLLIYMTR